jgi:hypothetical protein
MDSSRNIVLALLVVGIALAVVYMIDPTMFGMVGSKPAENFQNMVMKPSMEYMNSMENMLPSGPNSVSGFKSEQFQDPQEDEEIIKKNAAALEELTRDSMPSMPSTEGFQNAAPSMGMEPANCYPKNQLSPQELLPTDPNSKWAQVNPSGQGDISGKNFLNAGALVGVNTVGQSLRNANQQLRSEPPCPQMQVSIWNQSTIEPDLQRRPLEGF